jgi:hypothetical protein
VGTQIYSYTQIYADTSYTGILIYVPTHVHMRTCPTHLPSRHTHTHMRASATGDEAPVGQHATAAAARITSPVTTESERALGPLGERERERERERD